MYEKIVTSNDTKWAPYGSCAYCAIFCLLWLLLSVCDDISKSVGILCSIRPHSHNAQTMYFNISELLWGIGQQLFWYPTWKIRSVHLLCLVSLFGLGPWFIASIYIYISVVLPRKHSIVINAILFDYVASVLRSQPIKIFYANADQQYENKHWYIYIQYNIKMVQSIYIIIQ